MKRILAYTLIPLAVLACAGPQINVEEEVEEETKTYSLDLQKPENSTVWEVCSPNYIQTVCEHHIISGDPKFISFIRIYEFYRKSKFCY